jgi:2-keto-4-pentenoate hydratase/2-oxohepta-3-ene-1,7-dioic acid hydratase in catechol pathway
VLGRLVRRVLHLECARADVGPERSPRRRLATLLDRLVALLGTFIGHGPKVARSLARGNAVRSGDPGDTREAWNPRPLEIQGSIRLVSFESDGRPRVGAVRDDSIAPLPVPGMPELIAAGRGAPLEALEHAQEPVPLERVRLLPPVPTPPKLIGIGLNYRDHAAESGQPIPATPVVFAKYPTALAGAGTPIRIPPETEKADYEVELALVIARRTRNVEPEEALEAVFGYATFNDVSARDLQFSEGGQWTRSKSFDGFAPMGPYLVTADQVEDPQRLSLATRVNGETLQHGNTADMIFSVAEIVSFLSRGATLLAGDVIATGTPAGVGMAKDPPRFLEPGDRVECEVEGLGVLHNPVEAGGD